MPEPRGSDHLLALSPVALAVAAVYASSFGADLVLDSRALIVDSPVVHAAAFENVRFILTHDYWQPMATDGLYRPVTSLSYLLNYAVLGSGARPFGYHVVNLLLHLACIGLVYALLWQLVRHRWPAFVAAAIFGLHPIATEAVTYVVGRADELAAVGVLGGLLCHIRAGASTGRRRTMWTAGLAVAAAVAFFSKENGIVLVAVLVAYDLVFRRARLGRDHLLVGAVLVAYLATRGYVARTGLPAEDHSPIDNPIVEAGFVAGRLTAVKVMGGQLASLLFPATLSADYSYRQIPVVGWPPRGREDWEAVIALAVLAALAAAAVGIRRRRPAVFFLVVFSVLALLPTSNLLTVIGSINADRFLYLPLVGFAGTVALLAEGPARRWPRLVALALALVVVLAGSRTWSRNRDWADELRVWSSAVRASPASAKAHRAYGAALLAARGPDAVLDRAIAEAEQAVALRDDYLDALVDLGGYYLQKADRVDDARVWSARSADVLERARGLDARHTARFVEKMLARGHARGAIPDTGNPRLLKNLALAYGRLERFEDGLAAYEQLRRLEPTQAVHYVDISAVQCSLGRWEDASIALFQALAIAPDDGDAALRLVEVYRRLHPDGRAVLADGSGQVRLDLEDPALRRHRCRAYGELAEIYARALLREAAARTRQLAARFCGPHDAAVSRPRRAAARRSRRRARSDAATEARADGEGSAPRR